jgi:muconolactone delta-isomerase
MKTPKSAVNDSLFRFMTLFTFLSRKHQKRFIMQTQKVCWELKMKFLIIQKTKREVPLEKWAKMLPLQFKYFDQLEKQKTLEVCYHLIGQQGSMLIVNADSDEVLSRVIGEDPMFFYSKREVYPLTTRKTHERQIRKLLNP